MSLKPRVNVLQNLYDLQHHRIRFQQDLVRPEAHNAIPGTFQARGSPRVVGFGIHVLASVSLDYQARLNAAEVYDELSNCVLTSELEPGQPPVS